MFKDTVLVLKTSGEGRSTPIIFKTHIILP